MDWSLFLGRSEGMGRKHQNQGSVENEIGNLKVDQEGAQEVFEEAFGGEELEDGEYKVV